MDSLHKLASLTSDLFTCTLHADRDAISILQVLCIHNSQQGTVTSTGAQILQVKKGTSLQEGHATPRMHVTPRQQGHSTPTGAQYSNRGTVLQQGHSTLTGAQYSNRGTVLQQWHSHSNRGSHSISDSLSNAQTLQQGHFCRKWKVFVE